MNNKLLPQANSLSTIIKVFLFTSIKENCTKEDIADFCNFDLRQSDYYIGACVYLGLLDPNCNLTSIGKDILQNDREHCKERIYDLIIRDELCGKFFSRLLLFPKSDIKTFAIDETTKLYPQYSEAVIIRRSSAMVGWCKEIIEYVKLQ